ncbi:hypothetical protein Tco_1515759 [Tanacetum coccineum]
MKNMVSSGNEEIKSGSGSDIHHTQEEMENMVRSGKEEIENGSGSDIQHTQREDREHGEIGQGKNGKRIGK